MARVLPAIGRTDVADQAIVSTPMRFANIMLLQPENVGPFARRGVRRRSTDSSRGRRIRGCQYLWHRDQIVGSHGRDATKTW
jgi:hypothetical protein